MSPSLLAPLWALLSLAIPAGAEWFYPGAGDAMVRLEEGPGGLHINGFPVERTGYLLARVADAAALRALAAMPEVAEVEVLAGDGHVVRVRPRESLDELTLCRLLRERHMAVWSHPDFLVETAPGGLPNDPYVSGEWHLTNVGQRGWTRGVDINAELAWTRSIGTGGLAAVIDTGVDAKHPDLRATLGHDYIDRDEDSSPVIKVDGAPHGTAVSGIIAAVDIFLGIGLEVIEHRPEAGGVDVFPAAIEGHEQPALPDRLIEHQPDILHRIIIFRESHLAPIRWF